ncbi:hypothetical protein PPTG_23112 [Phytophthora nicotianae INRA-310]|uniref:Uncharacterized protein n=2 Tax=Phytophthora nicotianae TaxID=4792 RepID=W2Q453_PHYN3|nr:hypothetical protein PPTG_23112 [Phytophthora nicotianae INRA-310]ETM44334.1 hypothetical protein L914_10415 [Phytophthora nicotianae]ETN07973.1 hypothetical protein PPTG_23112 [Phytophthora nicotianae INRA-310]
MGSQASTQFNKTANTHCQEIVVRRLAVRAPIKGKIEEQLYLLESMVPEWLTVVLDSGKE